MDYHPGGEEELLRGAGIDATNLFNEVHRWVNYESMLKACLVGKLIAEPLKLIRTIKSSDKEEHHTEEPLNPFKKSPVVPPIAPVKKTQRTIISHDWYQTGDTIVITIYTKKKTPEYSITPENVLVEISETGSTGIEKTDNEYLLVLLAKKGPAV